MTTRTVGARITRTEDPRLLRGAACFVDDVNPAGVLHGACLRSPHAHGPPLVQADGPDNRAARFPQRVGDPDGPFATATHVFRERFVIERSCGSPIEGRGVAAELDARTGVLRVWSSTQAPLPIKN